MSLIVPLIVRIAGLFGIRLNGFAAGAIITAGLFLAFGIYSYKLYDAGYASAHSQCEADALRSQLEAVQADRDRARLAAASASLRMAAIEAQSMTEKEGTAKYVEELRQRVEQAEKATTPNTAPINACALTCDDLRGMRIPSAACGTAKPRPASPSPIHVPGFWSLRGSKR
jgi:hypothetical protein